MITTYTDDQGRETFLPFTLPEGKSGDTRVVMERKPAGTILPIVSARNAIYMGLQQRRAGT